MNQSYCLNISRSKYFKVDRGPENQRNIFCHFLNNLDRMAHGPLARAKKIPDNLDPYAMEKSI